MIVLVHLIVLLRNFLFPLFFAWCIHISPFIQLNDFYTCYTFFLLCVENTFTHIRTLAPHLA